MRAQLSFGFAMPSFRSIRRVRHSPADMFDLVADVEAPHELREVRGPDAATARELLEQRVRIGDLRAPGDHLGAHDRLDRLAEHLPVVVEVGGHLRGVDIEPRETLLQ
jgi:hypothetical protein